MMRDTSAPRLLSEKDRIEILQRVVPEFPITRLIRRKVIIKADRTFVLGASTIEQSRRKAWQKSGERG